jgi:hypothetical protein
VKNLTTVGGGGEYTIVYNLMFVPSCNFANYKSDLSPNQTQVDLSFLKDATRRSCLRLRPLDLDWGSAILAGASHLMKNRARRSVVPVEKNSTK